MDYGDKEGLKGVLVNWYGPQANTWDMNDAVLCVVLKMLSRDRPLYRSDAFCPAAYDVRESAISIK